MPYENTKTITIKYHSERKEKECACAFLYYERCCGKRQNHKLETIN